MTLATTSNTTVAQGNGLTTSFSFSFPVPNASELFVYLTNPGSSPVLLSNSQYSTTGIGTENGGSVTYPLVGSPIPVGSSLTIQRKVPYLQLTSLIDQSGYYPNVVENALDYLTMQTQQLAQGENLTLMVPLESTIANLELPTAAGRANALVGFDSSGNAVTYPLSASVGAGNLTLEGPFLNGPGFTPGVTTTLLLSKAYGTATNVQVHFDTDYQGPDQYSISGTQIIFNSPIPNVSAVYIVGGTTLSIGVPANGSVGSAQLAAGAVKDINVASGTALYGRITKTLYVTDPQFGADPTGAMDSTAAIQAALTAAGVGGRVRIPAGTYLLSATLIGLANQMIEADGPNATIFRRFGDYGDTLKFPQASACSVRGIWFWHSTQPVAPFTTLANQITVNPQSAHVRLQNAQGALIEDCWMWRMPYGVSIDSGSLVTIHKCNIQGVWDGTLTACQEGIAGVLVGGSTAPAGYTQIVKIDKCYFGGSGNGPRSLTWTCSDTGTNTQTNVIQDVGNKYAILVNQCEDLLISNNYMGGNWIGCIGSQLVASSVNLDWRIIGNFIDGAGAQPQTGSLILFETASNGAQVTGVTINGNVFNGEVQTFHGIMAYNPFGTAPVVVQLVASGNTFQAIVGSAVMVYNGAGWKVNNNFIAAYNCQGYSHTDQTFAYGVWASTNSANIEAFNNTYGPTINAGSGNSFCYFTCSSPQTVNEQMSYYAGAGSSGVLYGTSAMPGTSVSANYSMTGYERYIGTNTTSGAVQITLPVNAAPGYVVTVHDETGTASSHAVQLVGTVDGSVNPILNTNYFSKSVRSNGSGGWVSVGN